MPKNNKEFFKVKKVWSEVKDELLGCYLVPYFSKILTMGYPILYVDCFAGKGKFDDGKPGSPLIAFDSIDKSLSISKKTPSVSLKFIELNHADDLERNLSEQQKKRCEIISGKFEDNIVRILLSEKQKHSKSNVFLYIDPYGVKVLNAELFDTLTKVFTTAELLINLNSFGFIREACRVKNVNFREGEAEVLSDLAEYDSSVLEFTQELNDIAGGDYWIAIIDEYAEGKIDCYQAEKEFSRKYKLHLQKSYKYVLDLPIRLKQSQHPKYRMIHATNHRDGCILMADNMAKRSEYMVYDIQGGGQLTLFPMSADNEIIDDETLTNKAMECIEEQDELIGLNEFLARFFSTYGVLANSSRVKTSALKTLEDRNRIEVIRDPSLTPTGKKATSWTDGKEYTISLRKRS